MIACENGWKVTGKSGVFIRTTMEKIDLITAFIACGRVFLQDKLCCSVWLCKFVGVCWLMLYVDNMTWAAQALGS